MGFYLTGGTALSRGYFNHRFSDDLDYFTNKESDFTVKVLRIINLVKKRKDFNLSNDFPIQLEEDFARIFLEKITGSYPFRLKIDFVKDIPLYFGETVVTDLGIIDNLENILVNKITALPRYEPKDVADIWIISKNREFNWREELEKAKMKDRGVNEIQTAGIIGGFPEGFFSKILWSKEIDKMCFLRDLNLISREILEGSKNSLVKANKNEEEKL